MWAPIVSQYYSRYMFNNFIIFTLASIGVGVWVSENLNFLGPNSEKARVILLSINLLISGLLWISITFGYILWIRFINLVRPSLEVGISKNDAVYQQKNLKLKLSSPSIIPYYCIELMVNLISPYPWFYDTHYYDQIKGKRIRFYINTNFL